MEKTYKVIKSDTLSNEYNPRYIVVDTTTGEILDDAQGYGYKTIQKAYAAYAYKNRDRSKDKEIANRKRHIQKWMKEHKSFIDDIDEDCFESFKNRIPIKINTDYIRSKLKEHNLEIDFEPKELVKELNKR